jgi:L-asparagine transporter-like permease
LVEDTIIAPNNGEFAAVRFQQLRQEAELLAGGSIAFALLALGAVLSAWRIEGWWRFLTAVAIMAVVLTVTSISLCLYRYRSAHQQALAKKC